MHVLVCGLKVNRFSLSAIILQVYEGVDENGACLGLLLQWCFNNKLCVNQTHSDCKIGIVCIGVIYLI